MLAEPVQEQHDAYLFRLMSSTGDSVWSRTLRLHTAPFTEEHRQSWLERMSSYPGAAERISLPIWLSPVRYIRVGDDGTIWVRGILQDDQRAWSVISGSGNSIGMIWLDDDLFVQDVSREGALVARDLANGQVVLYRLVLE